MKPQIVTLDLPENHKDPKASRDRIYRGASWKKQRIVVILPAADQVDVKCVMYWWNLGFPPNQPVVKLVALGQEVGEAYSNTIQSVLDHPELSQWEYILTLEADNAPPGDGVARLVMAMDKHPEFACIGGLYFTKGLGGVPQIWGDPMDPVDNYRPQPPDLAGGLVECCGTGMGFNLWRISMFKDERLRKPWFKTLNGTEGQGMGTQDLYFWNDARKYGYRCAVDCSVKVGHYDGPGKFGDPDTMY